MKEMSEKIRLLEGKIEHLEKRPTESPINAFLKKKIDPDTCLEWFGVTSFASFHALVQSYLQSYRGMEYDWKQKLEQFLIQL